MPIQDSDPERRNLVLTSIAFVVFHLAEGSVTKESFRLQIVPVTFDNVVVLQIFAWVMLGWFGLRYWQTHRSNYKDAYFKHLQDFNREASNGARYIEKSVGVPEFNENEGFRENELVWLGKPPRLHVRYSVVEDFAKNEDGSISIKNQQENEKALTGWEGLKLKALYFLSFAIKTPGFTSYAAPYILFFVAVSMPLLKAVDAIP